MILIENVEEVDIKGTRCARILGSDAGSPALHVPLWLVA